jgi:hypothetical protein
MGASICGLVTPYVEKEEKEAASMDAKSEGRRRSSAADGLVFESGLDLTWVLLREADCI